MKTSYRGHIGGFTLIELLVVVLIIGILSAVALPQYRIAVEKAHVTEALIVLRNIEQAQKLHYLENGSYVSDIKDLDVEIPGEDVFMGYNRRQGNSFIYDSKCEAFAHTIGMANRIPFNRHYYLIIFSNKDGVWCRVLSDFGRKVCKSLSKSEKIQMSGAEFYTVDY